MRATTIIAATSALLALAACSNGEFAYSSGWEDFKTITGYGTPDAEQAAEQQASQASGAPLIVGFEAIRVALPYAGDSDGSKTYSSRDGVTIAMNSGIVTRATGLGIDMNGTYMSVDNPFLGNLVKAAQSGNSSDKVVEYWEQRRLKRDTFRCKFSIQPRKDGGSVIDEACKRYFEPTGFVNRYWIDAEDRIECSRQWIHPSLSPLQFFSTVQQALELDLTKNGC